MVILLSLRVAISLSWVFFGRTVAETPPDVKNWLIGKDPDMLGRIEGKRRRRWQRLRWLNSITDSVDLNLSKLQEVVEDRGAWHAAVHGVEKSRTRLSNWTIATTTNLSQSGNGRVITRGWMNARLSTCQHLPHTERNPFPQPEDLIQGKTV